jgi:hypothetical protein
MSKIIEQAVVTLDGQIGTTAGLSPPQVYRQVRTALEASAQ